MTAKICTIRGQGHLRESLNLNQDQFAASFSFSDATLCHWELGDRSSSGASLVLLSVIDRNPLAVLNVFQKKFAHRLHNLREEILNL